MDDAAQEYEGFVVERALTPGCGPVLHVGELLADADVSFHGPKLRAAEMRRKTVLALEHSLN